MGGKGRVHLGVFLRVHYGGDGDAEVGDWAPEIWRVVSRGSCSLRSRVEGTAARVDVRVEQT